MNEKPKKPFSALGLKLKKMREDKKESLAQVCSAVEIDIKQLLGIESGNSRPTEETLLLLISHFNPKDDEAMNLWNLAGYDKDELTDAKSENLVGGSSAGNHQIVIMLPLDTRAVYSDSAQISTNRHGVTLSFMQKHGFGNRSVVVSKVGISREHAKKIADTLYATLKQTETHKPQSNKHIGSTGGNTDETPKN